MGRLSLKVVPGSSRDEVVAVYGIDAEEWSARETTHEAGGRKARRR